MANGHIKTLGGIGEAVIKRRDPCKSCREKDDKIKELEEQLKPIMRCNTCENENEYAHLSFCCDCKDYSNWEKRSGDER